MGDQNGDAVHEIAKYYIWLLSYLPTTENSGCKLSNIERKPGEYKARVSQTQVWGRMLEFSIIIILAVLLQLLLPAMIPTKILKPVGKH